MNISPFTNTVIRGDAFDILSQLPPQSIDCIIADMPYGITGVAWDTPIDLPQLWKLYHHIIKPSGVICLFGGQPFTSTRRKALSFRGGI